MRPGVVATDPAGNRTPPGELSLIDVRNTSGDLVGRVPAAEADELEAAGIVSPIGQNRVKYLLLARDEPTLERVHQNAFGVHGGNVTTHRVKSKTGRNLGWSRHVDHNSK